MPHSLRVSRNYALSVPLRECVRKGMKKRGGGGWGAGGGMMNETENDFLFCFVECCSLYLLISLFLP